MKRKTNNNPGSDKRRREALASLVYLDVRLLYGCLQADSYLDKDFKYQTVIIDSMKYHLIDSKIMNDFINHLIDDYRMN